MNDRKNVCLLVARLMMASLFLFSGSEKLVSYDGFIHFAAAGGLPFPRVVSPFIIAAELIGGLMLVLGYHTRLAAGYFALFCFIAGPMYHQFWSASVPQGMWQVVVDGFFHHLVMAGGFLYVVVHGPGALSLDARTDRPIVMAGSRAV